MPSRSLCSTFLIGARPAPDPARRGRFSQSRHRACRSRRRPGGATVAAFAPSADLALVWQLVRERDGESSQSPRSATGTRAPRLHRDDTRRGCRPHRSRRAGSREQVARPEVRRGVPEHRLSRSNPSPSSSLPTTTRTRELRRVIRGSGRAPHATRGGCAPAVYGGARHRCAASSRLPGIWTRPSSSHADDDDDLDHAADQGGAATRLRISVDLGRSSASRAAE